MTVFPEGRPMSALAEFLRTEGKEIAAKARENQALLDEWRKEVDQFLFWIRAAITEADAEGTLFVRQVPKYLREVRFGEYELPALEIVFGATVVSVTPRARFLVGELKVGDPPVEYPLEGWFELTDGALEYHAYRVRTPDGVRWFLTDRGQRKVTPLTRDSIQDVLLELLR
jgi:hypothetical protein